MLRTVHLHGRLGKKFGRKFELAVNTPTEAIRALVFQLPGFGPYIRHRGYVLTTGDGGAIDEAQLQLGMGRQTDIHVIPAGAAAGIETILLGATLLFTAVAGIAVLSMPKVPTAASREEATKSSSFIFDGPQNVTEQGHPVPLVYGQFRVGSVVVSAGIATTDANEAGVSADPNNPYYGQGYGGYVGSTPGIRGSQHGDEWVRLQKGGKGGGGSSARAAQEDPNTLQSQATAKVLDVLSEGEIVGLIDGLKSIYFDETPLQNADGTFNFSGVAVEQRVGLPDQDFMPGFTAAENVRQIDTKVSVALGPVTRSVTDPTATVARVTIRLPQLYQQDTKNGDLRQSSVSVRISVQADGGGFTEVLTKTFTGKTNSGYQWSTDVRLPAGQQRDIRVTRLTADSNVASLSNETRWDLLTEIVEAKLSYPDTALIGLTVDARQFGSNIPGRSYDIKGLIIEVPSNYDPVARTYAGVWDGTWKRAWTDNPAWVLRDIIVNRRYGLGQRVRESAVDKWGLYAIAQHCDGMLPDGKGGMQPRFTINCCINNAAQAYDVVASIASTFRGFTYWGSGNIVAVQDRPEDPSILITPSNVVDGRISYGRVTPIEKRRSVAVVYWNDPSDGYRLTPAFAEDPELIRRIGRRGDSADDAVTAFGCTNEAQAVRAARWILEDEAPSSNTTARYEAGDDHGFAGPGRIAVIADPKFTQSRRGGRVRSATVNGLQLDAAYTFVAGRAHQLRVTLPDGTVSVRPIINEPGPATAVQLGGAAWTTPPNPGAVWTIETDQVANRQFRIRSIATDEPPFAVQAVLHDPTKYPRVELGLDIDTPNFLDLPTGPLQGASAIDATEFLLRDGDASIPCVQVSWQPSADPRVTFYQAQYKAPGGNWEAFADSIDVSRVVRGTQAGEWQFRVRALDSLGRKTAWLESTVALDGQIDGLPNVVGLAFKISNDALQTMLVWVKPDDHRPLRYRVRFSPDGVFDNSYELATIDTQEYVVSAVGTYWVETLFLNVVGANPPSIAIGAGDMPAVDWDKVADRPESLADLDKAADEQLKDLHDSYGDTAAAAASAAAAKASEEVANAAKELTQQALSDAQGARDAAEAAQSAALGSASASAASQIAADDARAQAQQAKNAAEAAQEAALGHASAADAARVASEASATASASATSAAQQARDDAQTKAQEADGSAQAAAGSAQVAQTARDAAGSSASAAAASQVSARLTVATALPSTLVDGGAYFTRTGYGAGPETAEPLSGITVTEDGPVYGGWAEHIGTRGVLPWTPGRTYELEAKVRGVAAPSGVPHIYLWGTALDASYNLTSPQATSGGFGIGAEAVPTPPGQLGVTKARHRMLDNMGPAVWVRYGLLMRRTAQVAPILGDAEQNFISLSVRDVTALVDSEASASAAATSASSAAASETAAGQQAAAAETAKVAAETARGGAQAARDAAAASESSASGSASAASQSATLAATARDLASDYATNAQQQAAAAAGSASNASASATTAGQKAEAADASAVSANTSRAAAQAAQGQAATSETNAAGSASAAASSASLSATATSAAQAAMATTFPEVFDPGALGINSAWHQGLPTGWYTSTYYQDPPGETANSLGMRGLLPYQEFKVYELTTRLKAVATPTYFQRSIFWAAFYDAAGGFVGEDGASAVFQLSFDETRRSQIVAIGNVPGVSVQFNVPGAASLRFGLLLNRAESLADVIVGATTRVYQLSLRDITERYNAALSATASASSASAAAASQTAAGQQATASENARIAAQTAQGGAESARDAAAASQSSAAGSASAASQSATIAANASTAAGDARDAASQSASAAAGSASNASASATEASQKASAAQASATAADTAKGAAQAAQSAAAQSETNSAGSASSAASSASLSASASQQSALSLAKSFPENFDPRVFSYQWLSVGATPEGQQAGAPLPANFYGPGYYQNPPNDVRSAQLVMVGLVPYVPGNVVELTLQRKTVAWVGPMPADGFYVLSYNETFNVLAEHSTVAFDTTPAETTTKKARIAFGAVVPGVPNTLNAPAGTKWLRYGALLNRTLGNPGLVKSEAVTVVYQLFLRDVTPEVLASASASAAASSASTAAAAQNAAGQSASASDTAKLAAQTAQSKAETARNDAATSSSNAAGSASAAATSQTLAANSASASGTSLARMFPRALSTESYTWNPGALAQLYSSPPLPAAVLVNGAIHLNTVSTVPGNVPSVIYMRMPVPWIAGRTYRTVARLQQLGGASSHSSAYAIYYNADGAYLGEGLFTAVIILDGSLKDYAVDFVCGVTPAPSGTAFARFALVTQRAINSIATVQDGVTAVYALYLDDVSPQRAAEGSASAAASSASTAATSNSEAGQSATAANQSKLDAQAANALSQGAASASQSSAAAANSAAAAAQASAVLSASVGQRSLNKNPAFADMQAAAPWATTGWSDWFQPPTIQYRVDGKGGGYGRVQGNNAGWQTGIVGDRFEIRPGYYVIDYVFELLDGALEGAGIYLSGMNTAGQEIETPSFALSTLLDTNGYTAGNWPGGDGFRVMRGSKLVQLVNPTLVSMALVAMTSWSGFTGAQPYKQLAWHFVGLRAASDQERAAGIALPSLTSSVTTLQSAVAGIDGRTQAYWSVSADAGGTAASIEARAVSNPDGSTSSRVGVVAEEFSVTNSAAGVRRRVLSVTGSEVLINGNLAASAGVFLGNGTKWAYQLRTKNFAVSDGTVVDFGVDLGSVPTVDFSTVGLAPLAAGETYRLYADNLTPTGFVARLRIGTPGTTTAYNLNSSVVAGSGPTRQIARAGNPESSNGVYTVRASGTLRDSSYDFYQ